MTEVDAFDGDHWYKSTILSTQEIEIDGAITTLCHVAYRVYREPTANRNEWDSRGSFDGKREEYDEWLPIYSPRIAPYNSMVGQTA